MVNSFARRLGLMALVGLSFPAMSQLVIPTELATLPSNLDGTSGLEYVGANSIWTHNDNGSGAFIYEIDQQGAVLRTIEITNAAAVDFEDMAQDNNGNLYVGDFGNKFNDRTDLKVYRVPPPSTIMGTTVQADVIEFLLPDQTQFPPPKGSENFDIESMVHFNGKLYLFTKDRSQAGETKLYSIPDSPGQHGAAYLGKFKTNVSVSGADISPDGKTVVLVGNKTLWVFYNYVGNDFYGGSHTSVDLPFTQKEGIVFSDNENPLMVDNREENPTHGKLYSLAIPNLVSSVAQNESLLAANLQVFPNPTAKGPLSFQSDQLPGNWTLELLSVSGSRVAVWSGNGKLAIDWQADAAPAGVYFYQLSGEGISPSTGKVILQ